MWLAAGPLIVLLVGVGLLLGLREEEGPEKTTKAVREGLIELPSGLEAEFHEMLWNEPGEGLTYRFRFIAPALEPGGDVEAVMADLKYLCEEYALNKLATTGPKPSQVIISVADAPSEFGTYNPDIIQVFEAFDVRSGACIWEEF
jgi:hypothetical protein